MATNTTKLALVKPDGTDLVDIAVLNANADKIDAASGATICTSSTRPATPFNGQVIFETDTLNALVYRSSTTSWAILGGSTVASDPPAGAGNGNFWWDSDNGKLYIYYNDGNSGQWVSVMPSQTTVEVANNVIINGAFDIWQRGTSGNSAPGVLNVFVSDRWNTFNNVSGSTVNISQQTFTPGSAPSQGNEGRFFLRATMSGYSSSFVFIGQKIEDVRTLAGRTATLSFWAKANTAISLPLDYVQNFGVGGSSLVNASIGSASVTTSWQRFTFTFNVPALSGKTIGAADNNLELRFLFGANASLDIWGVQLEEGTVATKFRRNQANIQAELAACQRYYWRTVTTTDAYATFGMGIAHASNQASVMVSNPVDMRVPATAIDFNALAIWDSVTVVGLTNLSLRSGHLTTRTTSMIAVVAGNPLPQYRPWFLLNGNSAAGFLGVSAEL